ncbi:hypothetical protein FNV43_RR12876 [Rhamnella rubrinervis]|uniref:O-methyltransferase C-terminal domain-containing protein n=1 Tax=Rhamnella rubrinervis TaxID=2594499 RepID=A0A8K0ME96_9ROSA|nr:hypothetical protein FNV43_RR12876 [Rhamnella rubrinervis]
MLVHTSFFAKHQRKNEEEEEYSLTLAFRLLPKERWPTKSHPIFSISDADSLSLNPMLSLSTWFKNSDKTVLETAHLTNIWYSTNPDTATNNSMFNEMMSLVDVGGGTGTMSMAIANTFPHMKCTVLDLPNGVVSLQGTENLAFVAGDIFEAIPPANAILLKRIRRRTQNQFLKLFLP